MRDKIILIILLSLISIAVFSQDVICDPICLGPNGATGMVDAGCSDNYGSGYTYIASTGVTVDASGVATYNIPANFTAPTFDFSVTCTCDDPTAPCENVTIFSVPVSAAPDLSCQLRTIPVPPGQGGYVADGNQGNCTHRVCETDQMNGNIPGLPAGSTVEWTDISGAVVATGNNTEICSPCTDGDVFTATVTFPDGCVSTIDVTVQVKLPVQLEICDP